MHAPECLAVSFSHTCRSPPVQLPCTAAMSSPHPPHPAHLSGCAGMLQAEVVPQLMEDGLRTGAIAALWGGGGGGGVEGGVRGGGPAHIFTLIVPSLSIYLQPSVAAAAAAD